MSAPQDHPRVIAADVRFPERYERQADLTREYLRVGGGNGDPTLDRIERLFARTGVAPVVARPSL